LIQKVRFTNDSLFIKEIDWLIGEARELMLILSSIINKAKNK
jgi:hypothetical protein